MIQEHIQDPQHLGLIVLSGGMDSVTLLYEYRERIGLALSFDYGAKHNARELPCARYHCERLGIPHIIIPLGFMGEYFRSSLLLSGGDIPLGQYDEHNIQSTVVPFRNGIMLSIAAGLAESHALGSIYIANHFGDHALYPDCRASFIEPMTRAVREGTTNAVELIAPYTHLDKGQIASIGARLGIDYSHTWSCYQGRELHCGECSTCLERREAMAQAGLEDPTAYESKPIQ
ncbi:7-cyano-7-deazaguanine synthase QueC [Porphyromonas sp. COT-239 OH1446]|uniref:7-cyano-7-deazaguanine synthase QueC n=1 Tax=Porphyromonas sp. COT-239 OH1446 TaxID=1515613 RepID=UPI000689A47F|nr:7-cyano-7-deazaguanine synthase QueC [Porphyromonas sp. COT-239 OH1446]